MGHPLAGTWQHHSIPEYAGPYLGSFVLCIHVYNDRIRMFFDLRDGYVMRQRVDVLNVKFTL